MKMYENGGKQMKMYRNAIHQIWYIYIGGLKKCAEFIRSDDIKKNFV